MSYDHKVRKRTHNQNFRKGPPPSQGNGVMSWAVFPAVANPRQSHSVPQVTAAARSVRQDITSTGHQEISPPFGKSKIF